MLSLIFRFKSAYIRISISKRIPKEFLECFLFPCSAIFPLVAQNKTVGTARRNVVTLILMQKV